MTSILITGVVVLALTFGAIAVAVVRSIVSPRKSGETAPDGLAVEAAGDEAGGGRVLGNVRAGHLVIRYLRNDTFEVQAVDKARNELVEG